MASRSANAESADSFLANSSVNFRSALSQAVQSLEPFVPPRLDGPQFLVSLPLLINFPAVPLAAFECPGELKGWGGNLNERTALDLDFE